MACAHSVDGVTYRFPDLRTLLARASPQRSGARGAGFLPASCWRGIVGQRNVLAHEYGVIDQERLYWTGKESVPRLIAVLEKILERL